MSNLAPTTVALTGNLYLEHPISRYRNERFLDLVTMLRSADVTLTNMEGTIQDGEDWPAFVAGMGWSATYLGGPPTMIDEMKYFGIDAVCAANNHSNDFGENGVLTTIKHLRTREMPYAGIGGNLTEASEACYVEAPSGLRVGVISAVDWGPRGVMDLPFPWPFGFMASDERPPYKSRPGTNLLRYGVETVVDRTTVDELRRASQYLGWESAKAKRREGGDRDHPLVGPYVIDWESDSATEFFFMGRKFVVGDSPGTSMVWYNEDIERISTAIREARRQSDIVVVALHDQSMGVSSGIETFAHTAIDSGADIYMSTVGLHGGVEFYKSKVILYGQPSLWFQNELVRHVPSSAMALMNLEDRATTSEFLDAREQLFATTEGMKPKWTSPGVRTQRGTAVHQVLFDDNCDILEVRIQPLEVVPVPRQRSGLPLMPDATSGVIDEVLELATIQCARFGTTVDRHQGIGVIRPT